MRVSLRWLRELLPELPNDAQLISDRLTSIGLAVDAVANFGAQLRSLQVVAVRGVTAHPKRDQLRLVDVDRGGGTVQRVVCGAPNVPAPSGLVALAPVGSQLPGFDTPLAAREIGGVVSEGMLCSEAELGVADKSEGLYILPADSAAPGCRVTDIIPELDDVVFDLDITPNRPDALSHVGVARDLAASFAIPFDQATIHARVAALLAQQFGRIVGKPSEPAAGLLSVESKAFEALTIEVKDGERCPRYGAAAAVSVHIAPSPDFMRFRLHRLGIRPISNVVDITNWMLLLFGQPMHAFDWAKLRGNQIVVRRAGEAEVFSTLDGVQRKLSSDDLLITDGAGPTALAGVMGGLDSEISDNTSRVLLECAYFTPRGIRRTSRRHALHTESSHRFERGVDWGAIEQVLEHTLTLLEYLAGAQRLPGKRVVEGQPLAKARVTLRHARQDALLGIAIEPTISTAILARLGFAQVAKQLDSVTVEVPSHRPDVSIEADLVEEVARIHGLDKIPSRIPPRVTQPRRQTGQLERELTDIAMALGLSEALLYGFTSPQMLAGVKAPAAVVYLDNPLSEERSVMRTSLVPGLLEALGRARRRGEPNVRLFAVGSVFLPPDTLQNDVSKRERPRDAADQALPVEAPRFAAVLAGSRGAWLKKPESLDVFDAKGFAVELVERYLAKSVTVVQVPKQPHHAHLHPRGVADIMVEGRAIGWFGPLHPDVLDALDLGEPAQIIELDLAELAAIDRQRPRYKPLIRVPGIVRDVSFEVPHHVPAAKLVSTMSAAAGELCESVEPFDLFEGEGLAPGCRALAFRLLYRDPKAKLLPDEARTLTDAEVDERQRLVVAAVSQQLGLALRG